MVIARLLQTLIAIIVPSPLFQLIPSLSLVRNFAMNPHLLASKTQCLPENKYLDDESLPILLFHAWFWSIEIDLADMVPHRVSGLFAIIYKI